MNKNTKYLICAAALLTLPLSGCSNVKESLGLEKESPDEFAVITRAPLEMPSNTALPPPRLGIPRPQEKATISQAKEAVFGEDNQQAPSSTTSVENALLQKAGTHDLDPNIRSTINEETKELKYRNRPVAEKLLNIAIGDEGASATVVDAKKELDRIKKNTEEGKNITYGKTPIIEE